MPRLFLFVWDAADFSALSVLLALCYSGAKWTFSPIDEARYSKALEVFCLFPALRGQ